MYLDQEMDSYVNESGIPVGKVFRCKEICLMLYINNFITKCVRQITKRNMFVTNSITQRSLSRQVRKMAQ